MVKRIAIAQAKLILDMRNGGELFQMAGSTKYTLKSSDGFNVNVQYKTCKKLIELGLLNKNINDGLTELGKTIVL